MHLHAGIAVAGLIAISLCLTVTILELMKLKREALAEAAQKEEAGKTLNGPPFRHSHPQPGDRLLPALGCPSHLAFLLGPSRRPSNGSLSSQQERRPL